MYSSRCDELHESKTLGSKILDDLHRKQSEIYDDTMINLRILFNKAKEETERRARTNVNKTTRNKFMTKNN